MPHLFPIHRRAARRLPAFVAFGLLATSASIALADSSVFVTNDSDRELVLDVSSSLPRDAWQLKHQVVPPHARVEVFATNREKGVTPGRRFQFTADVTVRDPRTKEVAHQRPSSLALKLMLFGARSGSRMWHGVRTQRGELAWSDDDRSYSAKMRVGAQQWTVRYRAVPGGDDEDVEYVFTPPQ